MRSSWRDDSRMLKNIELEDDDRVVGCENPRSHVEVMRV
jgi:hypothetical protein